MKKKKIAFIIGITGQDGSYLSALLLKKRYKVFGFTRSLNKKNLKKLSTIGVLKKINLIKYNEERSSDVIKKIKSHKPNEIYYFSGQSSVGKSFHDPIETYSSNVNLLFYILEFCRNNLLKINIYNSCSTDCFGKNKKVFCNEKTIFNPQSPYARSKAFGFWLVRYYREKYKLKCLSGILSNHESPLRNSNFVIKKIVKFAINSKNKKNKLFLGNTSILRDWGWAPDYMEAIYKINNAKIKKDYVVGTGKMTSLNNIIKKIFKFSNANTKLIVRNSQNLLRTHDIPKIGCNINSIKKDLKWKPKISINQMVKKLLKNELY